MIHNDRLRRLLGNILFYAAIMLMIWRVDLLLSGVIVNDVLRGIASGFCVTIVTVVGGLSLFAIREWWSHRS